MRADAEAASRARAARRLHGRRPGGSARRRLLATKCEQLRRTGEGQLVEPDGPGHQPRLARRLRHDKAPASRPAARTGATSPSASCAAIVSRPGRAGAGGSGASTWPTGHHQLRPRPAEGVPGRPGRSTSSRSIVVGAIIGVASRGPANEDSSPTSPRSRRAAPTDYGASSTSCSRGSPSIRSTTLRAAIACPTGATPAGQGPARAGPGRARADRKGHQLAAAAGGRRRGHQLEEARLRSTGRFHHKSSSTAPTPPARPSTASTTCSRSRRPSTAPTPQSSAPDPLVDWTTDTDHHHRWSSTLRVTPTAEGAGRATTRLRRQVLSPDRQLARSTREHALRLERASPATPGSPTARLDKRRAPDGQAPQERQGCSADRADHNDSCGRSTAATSAPVGTTPRDSGGCSRLILTVVPRRSAGCASTGPSGHTVLITGALDFVVEPLRPLFDVSSSRPRWPSTRAIPGMVDMRHGQAGPRCSTRRPPRPDLARASPRLVERPADARGGRLPRRREPETRLASIARNG